MGSWFSSSRQETTKILDSTGQVNNNVVIHDDVKFYNMEMLVLLYVITTVKIISLVLYIYRQHKKKLRKEFSNEINSA